MKKEIIKIKGIASPPSPFNHVIKAGNFIFLTSQLSVDLKTNKIIKGNIEKQTKIALDNIDFLLRSVGSSMKDIVKVVIYMKNVKKDFKKMNKIYSQYFKSNEAPTRVTIQALSPIDNIDIEIEVVAVI